ncbi:hypothetical protein GS495_19835 [Rhodococcus hoagii]|nr:hypothetical protein [Prescottella equi]
MRGEICRWRTTRLSLDRTCSFAGGLAIAATRLCLDRLLALDPATGDLLHEQDVDAPDARAFLHPHPTGDTAVLELAMGQDGVLAYRVDVDGMRVHLTEILAGEDPVIAGFSPSGTGLLVTPYPSDPETVRILGWPV